MTTFDFTKALYSEPRREGEVDLVALVRGHLQEVYTQEVIAEFYDSHPLISSCANANSTVQKVNLSRYWTQQLMGVPNSQNARLHLVPGAEPVVWYKHFSEGVLPFCMSAGVFKKVH